MAACGAEEAGVIQEKADDIAMPRTCAGGEALEIALGERREPGPRMAEGMESAGVGGGRCLLSRHKASGESADDGCGEHRVACGEGPQPV